MSITGGLHDMIIHFLELRGTHEVQWKSHNTDSAPLQDTEGAPYIQTHGGFGQWIWIQINTSINVLMAINCGDATILHSPFDAASQRGALDFGESG